MSTQTDIPTPAEPEPFSSAIVAAEDLEDASARTAVHLITTAVRDELAALMAKLRVDHLNDLDQQVGYGTCAAIERAVYHLESAAWQTRPETAPEPVEPEKPTAWGLFEIIAGARKKLVRRFGEDYSAARQEAAKLNSGAYGVSYSAEPVEDSEG